MIIEKNIYNYLTKERYNKISNNFSIWNPNVNKSEIDENDTISRYREYNGTVYTNIAMSENSFYYEDHVIIRVDINIDWQLKLVQLEMLGNV